MSYDPDNSEMKSALPEDVVFEGAITNITSATVKDFVKSLEKWKDPDSPAINVDVEVKHEEKVYTFQELFTFRNEGDKVVYGQRSKLGKFAVKYGNIPKIGMKIKALTNSEGFLRLKIE